MFTTPRTASSTMFGSTGSGGGGGRRSDVPIHGKQNSRYSHNDSSDDNDSDSADDNYKYTYDSDDDHDHDHHMNINEKEAPSMKAQSNAHKHKHHDLKELNSKDYELSSDTLLNKVVKAEDYKNSSNGYLEIMLGGG